MIKQNDLYELIKLSLHTWQKQHVRIGFSQSELKNKNKMNYYSLNEVSPNVTFEEATVRGQAPDKGLYFPSSIPRLSINSKLKLGIKRNAELKVR